MQEDLILKIHDLKSKADKIEETNADESIMSMIEFICDLIIIGSAISLIGPYIIWRFLRIKSSKVN